MRKRIAFIIGSASLLLVLIGYEFYAQSIQGGQDTLVSIYQNDENGTPINSPSPIKLVRKAGHRNPFRPEISGYVLTTYNPLGNLIPRKNQTVRLRYRSALTKVELRDRLAEANYWQVGTQNVTTPIFNATQSLKGGRLVGRISTSRDGTYWSKLPISYPNETMRRPTFVYQNNRLTIFDQKRFYETTDFHSWETHRLSLKSNRFSAGRLQTVINTPHSGAFIVVQGTDKKTQKPRLYYGRWHDLRREVSVWKKLKVNSIRMSTELEMNRIGSQYYLLEQQGRYIQVLHAEHLSEKFKKITKLKLTVTKKHTINSLNLVTNHKQLRLFFNVVDRDGVQLGTYYQDFKTDLTPSGQPRKLSADYLWTSFEMTEMKR